MAFYIWLLVAKFWVNAHQCKLKWYAKYTYLANKSTKDSSQTCLFSCKMPFGFYKTEICGILFTTVFHIWSLSLMLNIAKCIAPGIFLSLKIALYFHFPIYYENIEWWTANAAATFYTDKYNMGFVMHPFISSNKQKLWVNSSYYNARP